MTEKLSVCNWGKTEIIADGEDHVYAYKIPGRVEQPIWCIWWDYHSDPGFSEVPSKKITFPFVHETALVTDAVTDADGNRITQILSPKKGEITLTLGTSPLFIEVLK